MDIHYKQTVEYTVASDVAEWTLKLLVGTLSVNIWTRESKCGQEMKCISSQKYISVAFLGCNRGVTLVPIPIYLASEMGLYTFLLTLDRLVSIRKHGIRKSEFQFSFTGMLVDFPINSVQFL